MVAFLTRVKFAFWTWFTILFQGRVPDDVVAALGAATPKPAVRVSPSPAPVAAVEPTAIEMLALLQRDGRLVDFLMEDIAQYADGQVGAAVREVHTGCRQSLMQHLTLTPVLDAQEGGRVTVDAGTDAARVKIVGNVSGQPPFQGVLRHRGWTAARVALPSLPPSARSVVAPAEVEVL
jgi:Domain of unknown function (DUF2760)